MGGSGWWDMGMSGLARKFWMMTSWMWPYFSWRARMARKGVNALVDGFADADEDAGGEGEVEFAGFFDGAEAEGGGFVGGFGVGEITAH